LRAAIASPSLASVKPASSGAVKATDYRTLATREPVAVPAVEAWRRKALWRARWSQARWQLAVGLPVLGVVALGFVHPFLAVFAVLVFALPFVAIVTEYVRFRRDRAVRIVLRFDRVWAVPNRAHWHGRALAAGWKALVGHSEALGIANPEAFLAVASDTVTWFPVREGLAVFDAITAAGCLPAEEQDELALLMEALSAAPPPSPSTEPLRFRLEYVDERDSRSANELFASGYCVAQTRDLRA